MNPDDYLQQDPYSQPAQPTPFGSATPLSPREEQFFRWAEDTTIDLFQFGLFLEGKRQAGHDAKGNKQIIETGEPLLDETGIHFVLTNLLSVCNKNTQLSEYSEEKIRAIAMDTEFTFIETLARKIDIGDIKTGKEISVANYQAVVTAYCNFIEASLWRSHKGGERNFISKAPVQQTNYVQGQERGPFGNLFR